MIKNLFKIIFTLSLLWLGSVVFGQQTTQTICVGTEATYTVDAADGPTGTPGSTYSWEIIPTSPAVYGGDDISNEEGNSISVNWGASTPGEYTVQVIETVNGCSGEPVTMTVTIDSEVTPTFAAIPPQCEGGSNPLPATSEQGITGTWSPAFDPDNTDTYTFTPDAGQCAVSGVTVEITVNPAPTTPSITLGDHPLCAEDDAVFNITGGAGDAVTYQIDGGTAVTINLDASGNYTVTVADVSSDVSITLTEVSNGDCSDTIDVSASITVHSNPTTTDIQFNP